MKKRNMAALALVAVMLLTACGRTVDTAVTTKEIVVPEMSSKDMLVQSLEYLLEEEPEEKSGETKESVQAEAVICYGKDMDSALVREEIAAEEITPDVLLNALAKHNIVPLFDTKALSAGEREEDGRRILYLDLSGSFREYLQTMSMEAECVIISSIVNTFLANYDVDAVYITVEGETLATSHATYAEALSGYTPAELMADLETAEDGAEENAEESEEQ